MNHSPIGIDIGSDQVKMLQLSRKNGQLLLRRKYLFPTPEGTFTSGLITETAALIEKLKKTKKDCNWHGRRAVLNLDNRGCFMTLVDMPPLSERELDQALRLEAENRFPLDPDKAVISYIQTEEFREKDRTGQKYLLAATAKQNADLYCDIALRAGFNPCALETATTALHRSTMHSTLSGAAGPEGLQVIINIGCKTSTLLFSCGKTYLFHRFLNSGIATFIQALLDRVSGTEYAARKLLFARGSLSAKGLLDTAGKLSRELKQTINYFFETSGLSFTKDPLTVYIGGGGIFIPGLGKFLQNELQRKIHIYDPLRLLPDNGEKRLSAVNNKYEGLLFPVAHGLALRGWFK